MEDVLNEVLADRIPRRLKALLLACKAPSFWAWMEASARERFEYSHRLSEVSMMLTTLVGILL